MDVHALLDRFPHDAPSGIPWVWTHSGGSARHLVIGCMVHGDETGSLPAALELIDDLESGRLAFGHTLSLFVGNPDAGRAGTRFVEADLNRVFLDGQPDSIEVRRARALRPLLDAADVFLDLHQTILETAHPFWINPWSPELERWVRAVGVTGDWVTRPLGASFSSGTCCADEYVRNQGRPAITLELGQQGLNPDSVRRASQAMRAMLRAFDAAEPRVPDAPLRFWTTAHKHPFDDPGLALRPGLVNFQRVAQGELLSAPDTPAIRSPHTGALLFPKYPPRTDGRADDPRPNEIVRVVTQLEQHPSAIWGE